jgi:serine/threonine-protein kinase
LGERLKQGPIAPAEMIDYASQAALGLAHAHEQGMVHRDIKPSNMLLTADRKIKILDLGLGTLMEADNNATFATADGIAVGTVDYMSPEQALGREVDGRSDLYSLGCAMYHLMTGSLAFPGESPIDRLGKRISSKPVPITEHIPELPAPAVRVIEKLMAAKPQDRYSSAIEASEALQNLLRSRGRPTVTSVASASAAVPASSPVTRGDTPQGAATIFAKLDHSPPAAVQSIPQPLASLAISRFPAWFRPLAAMAERRPTSVLIGLITTLTLIFGAGFGLGYLLR